MSNAQSGTLSVATGIFALNLLPLAWAVLCLVTLEGLATILFGADPGIPMVFIFTALVMHAALRMIASSGQVSGFDASLSASGTVPWLFMVRTLILSVPGVLTFFMVGGLIMPGAGREAAQIGGAIAGIAVNSMVYALFGTMLVEIAEGRDGDPEAALDEGRARFPGGFWIILLGPGIAEFCLFMLDLTARQIGLDITVIDNEAEHLSPVGLVLNTIHYAGSAFVAICMAAALTRLRAMPAD
ncbi:MAG: hypothetical protein AAF577_08080 [Pseudomonadota bacterium]